MRFVGSECGLGDCCELAEAPARADRVAHRLPSLAMTVEVAVREHHVRHVWTVGGEGDFDLAGLARVGFDLPVQVDVPAEAHKVRRFIGEHSRPSALAAVRGAVDDVAADVRFEDHLGQFALEDVMVRVPPRPDALREDAEGMRDGRGHVHLGRHRRRCELSCHSSSLVEMAAASRNATSASRQKPSK